MPHDPILGPSPFDEPFVERYRAPRPNGHDSAADAATSGPPTIVVKAGERSDAADQGIAALEAAGTAIYQRDRQLVRICDVEARSTSGEVILVPSIAAVTSPMLGRLLGQAARWRRAEAKALVPIDPPQAVVSQILDMAGHWPFPILAGVIGCPTLRPDGSLLVAEGYDLATGMVLRSGVDMPALAERPNRSDAEAAAALLLGLLAEFPFADDASKAVAMSMLLTPVVRCAMRAAPMHLVTAPQPGTGKSYLADVASTIATGERCAVVAVAPNPDETEKRLISSALAGHSIIGLDNCRDTLEGDFLCQLTERPLLQLRALGRSDEVRIANTFTTFANGNNVAVADDLTRRTIRCALDANIENPESRTFCGDPLLAVHRQRGAYIAACLTIARAYIAAGRPGRLPPLPSYEAWSDLVRSPLVWLGFADPVLTMAAIRDADPERQQSARIFEAWRADLGIDTALTVPELIERAEQRYDASPVHPDLLAALLEIAQKRQGPPGQIDPRRLGKWLGKRRNNIVSGFKLAIDEGDKRRPRYGLRPAG